MNSSVNSVGSPSISFQANLVTTLKGNKHILKPIADEFAKITARTPGEMTLSRASFEPARMGLKELEYEGVSTVTRMLNDDFAKDPAQIGEKGVKQIARKLADIFYSLKAEGVYKRKVRAAAEDVFELQSRIKELSKLKADSEKFGMVELAERYGRAIESCKQKIRIAEDKVKVAQEALLKNLDKYSDNEVCEVHRAVVAGDFPYDLKNEVGMAKLFSEAKN